MEIPRTHRKCISRQKKGRRPTHKEGKKTWTTLTIVVHVYIVRIKEEEESLFVGNGVVLWETGKRKRRRRAGGGGGARGDSIWRLFLQGPTPALRKHSRTPPSCLKFHACVSGKSSSTHLYYEKTESERGRENTLGIPICDWIRARVSRVFVWIDRRRSKL